MGMGGDILRRKILITEKGGVVKTVHINHTSIFLFVFFVFAGLGSGWAQSDTERPLRTIPQDPAPPDLYLRHSTYSAQTTPSLLTPAVLKQPLFLFYIIQYTNPSGIAT